VLPLLSSCSLSIKRQKPGDIWEQYLLVAETSIPPDFSMDSFIETGRDLDIAIIGEGFFRCFDHLTGEFYYSRHGHLNVNAHGNIVHASLTVGRTLEPAIFIPDDTEKILIHEN
jgi:flagellar basal-body rod protein FlgG